MYDESHLLLEALVAPESSRQLLLQRCISLARVLGQLLSQRLDFVALLLHQRLVLVHHLLVLDVPLQLALQVRHLGHVCCGAMTQLLTQANHLIGFRLYSVTKQNKNACR